jgi:hypothetical protein
MIDERFLALYIPVAQVILHYWSKEVGTSQTLVLSFINERTLRYGKEAEFIPQRHFLTGISTRDGDRLSFGLPIGRSCLWDSLDRLNRRDLIHYTSNKNQKVGNYYRLNLTKVLEPAMTGKLKSSARQSGMKVRRSLKIGKKSASKEGEEPHGSRSNLSDKRIGTYPINGQQSPEPIRLSGIEYTEGEIQKRILGDSLPRGRVDEVVRGVEEAGFLRRKARGRRAGQTLSAQDIKAAWATAVHTETGKLPETPTDKVVGIFKRGFKKAVIDRDLPEWFTLVVSSWGELKSGPMHWSDMPPQPSFKFLAYYQSYIRSGLDELSSRTERASFWGRREKRQRQDPAERKNEKARWRSVLGRFGGGDDE